MITRTFLLVFFPAFFPNCFLFFHLIFRHFIIHLGLLSLGGVVNRWYGTFACWQNCRRGWRWLAAEPTPRRRFRGPSWGHFNFCRWLSDVIDEKIDVCHNWQVTGSAISGIRVGTSNFKVDKNIIFYVENKIIHYTTNTTFHARCLTSGPRDGQCPSLGPRALDADASRAPFVVSGGGGAFFMPVRKITIFKMY